MKNLLIISVLLISGCSGMHLKGNDPWTKEQKVMQGASIVLRTMDWGTTLDMVDRPEYYEANPVLGKHPSKGNINTYFAASMLLNYVLADYLPSKTRTYWLGLNIAISAVCVGNNYNIGLRMNF